MGTKKTIGQIAVVLFLYLIGTPGWADETGKEHVHEVSDQHKVNVERLLELAGVPTQVDQAADDILTLYSAKITGDDVDSATKTIIAAYQKDLTQIVSAVLSWDAIKVNYINSYSSRMSEQEVQAVIQFFESSQGRAFVSHQSSATKEIKQTTEHLVDADLSGPLNQLTAKLRAGLVQIKQLSEKN